MYVISVVLLRNVTSRRMREGSLPLSWGRGVNGFKAAIGEQPANKLSITCLGAHFISKTASGQKKPDSLNP